MYDEVTQFKALGDPTRLALLHLISQHNGQLSVIELEKRLNALLHSEYAQPSISHHLKTLKYAGFIESSKHGLYVYYRLTSGAFLPVLDAITALAHGTRMEAMV